MMTPIEKRSSSSDRIRLRADVREMLPGFAGLVATEASLDMFKPDGLASAWTFIWSLSPLVFVLWVVLALVRSLRRADEYQRLVQLESLAVGFAVAMIVAITSSLLDAARIVSTHNAGGFVLYAGSAAWVGTLWLKATRSR
jgi:hypothetical protein